MVTIFLVIASITETVFLVGSLTTHSYQERLRNVTRVISFVVFSMFMLTWVVPWSFRWYGFAALLLIWAARGLWALFPIKKREVEYTIRSVTLRAAAAMLLTFISLTPALIFPPYRPLPTTGTHNVAAAHFTYTDKGRIESFTNNGEYRKVNAACWYPQNEGGHVYPLVIFSHGGLGTDSSNESLYLELASHGYVVCSIGHPYHDLWTTDVDGRVTFISMDYFQELQREDAKRDKQQSYRYYQRWMDIRTGDINFALDTILENAADGRGGLYGLVDVKKIGVIGHSLGGAAALAIPRQRNDIGAVIAIEAPFLYDIVGVENDKFVFQSDVYPVPVLNVYSDASWGHLSEWPQYERNYELLSSPQTTVFNLHLNGAGHYSLTDLALASPMLTNMLEGRQSNQDRQKYLREVNRACLEFFDHYLVGDNS